jgi:predicted nucleotidyltransferase
MKTEKSSVLFRIRDLVKEIDPTADVILYGSRARGEEHPDSDWDILILVDSKTDLDYERIFRHKLYDIELEVGEAFSVTVHNKNEWKSKYWMTPLYQNILREGIRI